MAFSDQIRNSSKANEVKGFMADGLEQVEADVAEANSNANNAVANANEAIQKVNENISPTGVTPMDDSVSTIKIQDEAVTRDKIDGDLKKHVTQDSIDDTILYSVVDKSDRQSELTIDDQGQIPDWIIQKWKKRLDIEQYMDIPDDHIYAIVDKNNRIAFGVNKDGTVDVYKFKENSIGDLALHGNIKSDDEASGLLWGIADKSERLSELVIDQKGQIPDWVLTQWKDRMIALDGEPISNIRSICCWGDSLTGGAGGLLQSQLWPGILATLINNTIYNMGVGGETSSTISIRQGGSHALVNNITIPADLTPVQIADQATNPLKDNWGKTVTPLKQQWAGVNPVTIKGIEGNLSITNPSGSSTWSFTRTTPGTAVTINRPTPIITNGMKSYRDNIMVLFMGQNGGWDSNDELIQQYRRMIEFNNAVDKEYLVLGLTSGTAASRADLEYAMSHEFGRRYINLRDYLVTYGLDDAGITPTSQDLTDISNGSVPTSLRIDSVHFTAACHQIIGNLVHDRMVELNMV